MTFPKLKTDAVAQYPLTTTLAYQNQTLTFVDGTQQRYRDSSAPQMRWEIRLTDLDEGELASIEEFFLANQGAFGSFAFTDPRDGQVYDECCLETDSVTVDTVSEMRGAASLIVMQNRR
jgi:phage-related protein